MYRFCNSVSVILILCIKVDNSFMGELLQDVNNYLKAVLYFLKALHVSSGLILQNCLMVLNCESLRLLFFKQKEVVLGSFQTKHLNKKVYHVESRKYRISIGTVLFNSQIVVCSSSTLIGTCHNPQPPSFTPRSYELSNILSHSPLPSQPQTRCDSL